MKFSNSLIVCTVIGVLLSSSLLSQDQSLIKHGFVPATDDHDTIRFGLLIPPSYKDNGQSYPVIYYLHGLNGQYANWQAQQVAELLKAAFSLDGSILSWDDFMHFQGDKPEIVNNSDYYYEHCSPNKWMSQNRNIILEKQDTALFITAAFLAPYHKEFLSILQEEGILFYYKELNCDHEFGCVFSEISDDLLNFLSSSLE